MAASRINVSLFLIFSLAWCVASQPYKECPSIGSDTSCQYRITFNSDGSATIASDPSQGPYDGIDDALVGVVNNGQSPVTSFTLNGPDIFGFDSDGLRSYCSSCGNPADQTGYAGPMNTFEVTSTDQGKVIFPGQSLMPGMSTYFSLEGQPAASSIKILDVSNGTSGGTDQQGSCFDPNDCDFYFEGYRGKYPSLALGNGRGDNRISPAILNSKDGGQAVNVINTNQGYATKSGINNDNQNQFYGSDKYVHDRTFNYPQNVDDFRNKCIKLRLSSVQLAQGNNPMNLNPNDGNPKYPEERRCVVFATN